MADELDPRLEASLRAALHHEADSLPLLIRSDDIERARRRRGGRRLALPASLLGLAAVLAILVATGVIGRLGASDVAASPSPSPSATDRPLVGHDVLLGMLGVSAADLQGEQPVGGPAGDPVTVDLGTLVAPGTIRYAIHCLGGVVTLTLDDGGSDPDTVETGCAIQPMTTVLPGSVRPYHVSITASPAVRWRVAMVAAADVAPWPSPTPEAAGFTELKKLLLDAAPSMPLVAAGEHLGTGDPAEPVVVYVGTVGPYDTLRLAFDCVGANEVWVAVEKGDSTGFSEFVPCVAGPRLLTDDEGSTAPENRIVITGDAPAVWRLAASAAGPSITGRPGDPPELRSFAELAAGTDSTLELGRAEAMADDTSSRTILADGVAATDLELALSCDVGSVAVTYLVRGVVVASDVTIECGRDASGISLDANVPGGADAVSIALDATGLTTWRAIVYDHSRGLKPELVAPVVPGASTMLGAFHGQSITGEQGTLEGDVAAGSSLAVAIACRGTGILHITVDGMTKDAPCEAATILAFNPPPGGHAKVVFAQTGPVNVRLELWTVTP